MKNKIRSLVGVVCGSRLTPDSAWKIRGSYWSSNTTEVIALKQIGVAIFAQRKHQLGRGRSRHINKGSAASAQIGIAIIELEPIGRGPVVGRLSAPDRP